MSIENSTLQTNQAIDATELQLISAAILGHGWSYWVVLVNQLAS